MGKSKITFLGQVGWIGKEVAKKTFITDYSENIGQFISDTKDVYQQLSQGATKVVNVVQDIKANGAKKIHDWFYDRSTEFDEWGLEGDNDSDFDAGYQIGDDDSNDLDEGSPSKILDSNEMKDIARGQVNAMYKIGAKQAEASMINAAEITTSINKGVADIVTAVNNVNSSISAIAEKMDMITRVLVSEEEQERSSRKEGIAGYNGMITLGSWVNHIKNQAKEAISFPMQMLEGNKIGPVDVVNSILENTLDPKNRRIDNGLRWIADKFKVDANDDTKLINKLIKQMEGESIDSIGTDLNKSFGYAVHNFLGGASMPKSLDKALDQIPFVGDLLKDMIGSVTGIRGSRIKDAYEMESQYTKDTAKFDGIVRTSIVEIIPDYLKIIANAVTGKEYSVSTNGHVLEQTKEQRREELLQKRDFSAFDGDVLGRDLNRSLGSLFVNADAEELAATNRFAKGANADTVANGLNRLNREKLTLSRLFTRCAVSYFLITNPREVILDDEMKSDQFWSYMDSEFPKLAKAEIKGITTGMALYYLEQLRELITNPPRDNRGFFGRNNPITEIGMQLAQRRKRAQQENDEAALFASSTGNADVFEKTSLEGVSKYFRSNEEEIKSQDKLDEQRNALFEKLKKEKEEKKSRPKDKLSRGVWDKELEASYKKALDELREYDSGEKDKDGKTILVSLNELQQMHDKKYQPSYENRQHEFANTTTDPTTGETKDHSLVSQVTGIYDSLGAKFQEGLFGRFDLLTEHVAKIRDSISEILHRPVAGDVPPPVMTQVWGSGDTDNEEDKDEKQEKDRIIAEQIGEYGNAKAQDGISQVEASNIRKLASRMSNTKLGKSISQFWQTAAQTDLVEALKEAGSNIKDGVSTSVNQGISGLLSTKIGTILSRAGGIIKNVILKPIIALAVKGFKSGFKDIKKGFSQIFGKATDEEKQTEALTKTIPQLLMDWFNFDKKKTEDEKKAREESKQHEQTSNQNDQNLSDDERREKNAKAYGDDFENDLRKRVDINQNAFSKNMTGLIEGVTKAGKKIISTVGKAYDYFKRTKNDLGKLFGKLPGLIKKGFFDGVKKIKDGFVKIGDNLKQAGANIKAAASSFKQVAKEKGVVSATLATGGVIRDRIVNKITGKNLSQEEHAARREKINTRIKQGLSGTGNILKGIAKWILSIVMSFAAVKSLIGAVKNTIQSTMKRLEKPITKIVKIVQPAIKFITDTLGKFADMIGELVSKMEPVFQTIMGFIPKILNFALKLVQPVMEGLIKLASPVTALLSALIPIVDTLMKIAEPLFNGLVNLITGVIELAIPVLTDIICPVLTFISSCVENIVGGVQTLYGGIQWLVGSVMSGFGSVIEAISLTHRKSKLKEEGDKIKEDGLTNINDGKQMREDAAQKINDVLHPDTKTVDDTSSGTSDDDDSPSEVSSEIKLPELRTPSGAAVDSYTFGSGDADDGQSAYDELGKLIVKVTTPTNKLLSKLLLIFMKSIVPPMTNLWENYAKPMLSSFNNLWKDGVKIIRDFMGDLLSSIKEKYQKVDIPTSATIKVKIKHLLESIEALSQLQLGSTQSMAGQLLAALGLLLAANGQASAGNALYQTAAGIAAQGMVGTNEGVQNKVNSVSKLLTGQFFNLSKLYPEEETEDISKQSPINQDDTSQPNDSDSTSDDSGSPSTINTDTNPTDPSPSITNPTSTTNPTGGTIPNASPSTTNPTGGTIPNGTGHPGSTTSSSTITNIPVINQNSQNYRDYMAHGYLASGDSQNNYGSYLNMSERGCGPVALADAANRRGRKVNAGKLAGSMSKSGTYSPSKGTSVGGFLNTASSMGMGYTVGGVDNRSLKRATPANPITLVGSGTGFGTRKGNTHYVNVIGTDGGGGAYVSNPLSGRVERRSTSDLVSGSVLGLYGSGNIPGIHSSLNMIWGSGNTNIGERSRGAWDSEGVQLLFTHKTYGGTAKTYAAKYYLLNQSPNHVNNIGNIDATSFDNWAMTERNTAYRVIADLLNTQASKIMATKNENTIKKSDHVCAIKSMPRQIVDANARWARDYIMNMEDALEKKCKRAVASASTTNTTTTSTTKTLTQQEAKSKLDTLKKTQLSAYNALNAAYQDYCESLGNNSSRPTMEQWFASKVGTYNPSTINWATVIKLIAGSHLKEYNVSGVQASLKDASDGTAAALSSEETDTSEPASHASSNNASSSAITSTSGGRTGYISAEEKYKAPTVEGDVTADTTTQKSSFGTKFKEAMSGLAGIFSKILGIFSLDNNNTVENAEEEIKEKELRQTLGNEEYESYEDAAYQLFKKENPTGTWNDKTKRKYMNKVAAENGTTVSALKYNSMSDVQEGTGSTIWGGYDNETGTWDGGIGNSSGGTSTTSSYNTSLNGKYVSDGGAVMWTDRYTPTITKTEITENGGTELSKSPVHEFFWRTSGLDHETTSSYAFSNNGNWFGHRNSPDASGQGSSGDQHAGVDIKTYPKDYMVRGDSELHAITGGEVIDVRFAGRGNAESPYNTTGDGGWGNSVQFKDAAGYFHRYAHMRDNPTVHVGDTIEPGTLLGVIGNTGQSTGEHVHYQINKPDHGSDNSYVVNPLTYFKLHSQTVQNDSSYAANDDQISQGSGAGEDLVWDPSSGISERDFYRRKIWSWLKQSKGFSDAGAAGIMGNFGQESQYLPYQLEGEYPAGTASKQYTEFGDSSDPSKFYAASPITGKKGYGLAQWTPKERKAILYRNAHDLGVSVGSLQAQFATLDEEMAQPYYGGFDKFKTYTDVKEAVAAWEKQFERAGVPAMGKRLEYAQQDYADFKGTMGDTINLNGGTSSLSSSSTTSGGSISTGMNIGKHSTAINSTAARSGLTGLWRNGRSKQYSFSNYAWGALGGYDNYVDSNGFTNGSTNGSTISGGNSGDWVTMLNKAIKATDDMGYHTYTMGYGPDITVDGKTASGRIDCTGMFEYPLHLMGYETVLTGGNGRISTGIANTAAQHKNPFKKDGDWTPDFTAYEWGTEVNKENVQPGDILVKNGHGEVGYGMIDGKLKGWNFGYTQGIKNTQAVAKRMLNGEDPATVMKDGENLGGNYRYLIRPTFSTNTNTTSTISAVDNVTASGDIPEIDPTKLLEYTEGNEQTGTNLINNILIKKSDESSDAIMERLVTTTFNVRAVQVEALLEQIIDKMDHMTNDNSRQSVPVTTNGNRQLFPNNDIPTSIQRLAKG